MTRKSVILFAILLIGLVSACSSGSSDPTPSDDKSSAASGSNSEAATAQFESCSGLLDLNEVQDASGRGDVEMGEPNPNSGPAASNGLGIKAMCIYEYLTPEIPVGGPAQVRISGPAMTLTGILFDSVESAGVHYRSSLEGIRALRDAADPDSDVSEGVAGDESYLLTVDSQGVGSVVAVQVGPYFISFHTTLPDGQSPLLVPEDLVSLAETVQERLDSNQ
ncbi:MAG: hypothetical protein O2913_13295 [Chloroflexi bacterium]|nr:hypothetical protein [Chloroflexota bacterium]